MSLSTHNLSVGYHDKAIVKQVNLSIPEGKIIALLGPNGCGKSTLLKAMARILSPMEGHVQWQGKNLHSIASKKLAQQLALLPQTQPIPEGIKVKDLVAYGRSPYTGFWGRLNRQDQLIIDSVMHETGITELADQLVSELSGGQRQRVWLAMTLAQDTPYLLLDEPTTYMDLSHQVELMHLLRKLNKQGKTIITVLHDINQAARYCDHLIVMKQGSIITQGSPDSVLTQTLMKDVFSLNAQIHRDPIAKTPMCVVE
ncbi:MULTISPECIES: Fe(3+) dicitrate ABC transporter ATP-binding protein FecE [Marinomonas]|uniref:Fe(3+) dicitrate ABC transporter ATP-binding protein FecE n=1 Tax=Marinomonas arctica TaxID=383750 RepID=A0A7H1J5B2_9GAMM|nr:MULTISPECIES: Fe(3+) dicitrate ABC transporter ATP-binding protein FecE [Marinomonas]MCS7486381.1 iron ABC transporter [Marinomonas sp. BSi20414]QNT05678.1 Fe(3+) dicitrate ABC transporter ATP-binding protein FecE [Marinomonas arctica]GGN29528.1 ferric citrate ABC transporter ATP-binding protein FecE [Marinomonas arctica]